MRAVPFGKSGLTVSQFGLGWAQLGGVFDRSDRRAWVRLIEHAVDSGVTFFDTADSYTHGESERLLGEALRARRQQTIIATKVGYCLPVQRRFGGRIKPILRPIARRLGLRRERLPSGLTGGLTQDFSPAYIVEALERSLDRLGTDYIDLYQLHSPPGSVLRADDWVEPLERLRQAGKIRCYGVACADVEDGHLSLDHGHVSGLQVGLSLLHQEAVDGLIPEAAQAGVGIIARQPFAAGFLTRPLDSLDALKVGDHNWPVERARISAFRAFARRTGLSPAALALRFLQSIPGVSVTLMSVSSEAQLTENLAIFRQPPLPPDILSELQSTFSIMLNQHH